MIYDDWCYAQNCEYYIDWEYTSGYEYPCNCTSCKLQGQSLNITEIAKECPFKEFAPKEEEG